MEQTDIKIEEIAEELERRKKEIMKYDKNNIFAKILRGEASAEKVYENEFVFCFKDIYPQSKIHILIIPKRILDIYDFSKMPLFPKREAFFRRKSLLNFRFEKVDVELLPTKGWMEDKKFLTYIFIY